MLIQGKVRFVAAETHPGKRTPADILSSVLSLKTVEKAFIDIGDFQNVSGRFRGAVAA